MYVYIYMYIYIYSYQRLTPCRRPLKEPEGFKVFAILLGCFLYSRTSVYSYPGLKQCGQMGCKLFTLRESRRGHWRLGGLEAGGSEPQVFFKGVFGKSLDVTCSKSRRQIHSFEFQHDLFQFQNDVKWHFSILK